MIAWTCGRNPGAWSSNPSRARNPLSRRQVEHPLTPRGRWRTLAASRVRIFAFLHSALAPPERRGCAPHFPFSNFDSLPENVFDFIEDRRPALGGLVFNFERCPELLDEFALLARELRWCQHA